MLVWINGKGSRLNDFVNKRASHSTKSNVVGRLDSLGQLAKSTDKEFEDGAHTWCEYNDDSGNFWIRDDVHGRFDFEHVEFALDAEYFSQNDENSDLSINDCGPASSATILAYDGVITSVNQFMKKAGISHGGFTSFADNQRGIHAYTYRTEFERPMHLHRILDLIVNSKVPVFSLVYYHQLYNGRRFGHFLVPVGYRIEFEPDQETVRDVKILVHDPNDVAKTGYRDISINKFAKAIGYVDGSGNMPFQSMYISNYKNPPSILSEIRLDESEPSGTVTNTEDDELVERPSDAPNHTVSSGMLPSSQFEQIMEALQAIQDRLDRMELDGG